MTSRILRLSDGRAVRVIEAGSGQPLFLLHGVGMRAEAWGPQIRSFSDCFRVIAVDLPGHGGSDQLPGEPRLPDFVAWAARVAEALELGPVAVAGHSMGALIAIGLAIEHPDLVRCVALLNAVYRRGREAASAVRARAESIAAGHMDIERTLARWFGPSGNGIRAQVAEWLRTVQREGYAAAYRAFAEGDTVYAERIREIRCPLLALTADGDPNSTPDMTRAIASMAPFGRAVIIRGHRHMVNLTAPDVVIAELRNWLGSECRLP